MIPRFEKELTDLLSHDGDAVEFECRVTGEPEPDIKWYHYTKVRNILQIFYCFTCPAVAGYEPSTRTSTLILLQTIF